MRDAARQVDIFYNEGLLTAHNSLRKKNENVFVSKYNKVATQNITLKNRLVMLLILAPALNQF